jgi:hypothetical protein
MQLVAIGIIVAVVGSFGLWAALRPRDIAELFLRSGGPLMDHWVNRVVGYDRYVQSIRATAIGSALLIVLTVILWSLR